MKQILRLVNAGDIKLFYKLNCSFKCTLFDGIMPCVTHLGSAAFTVPFCFLLIVFGHGGVSNAGWLALASLTASHLVVRLLKRTFVRPRPYIVLDDVNTYNINLKDYSFPSGHSAAVFSIFISVLLLVPHIGLLMAPFAVMTALSRIYLGVHYPTDVLVGIITGSAAALVGFVAVIL